ncbi:MAG: zf-HC2 domain-containing protein [Elusimicrobia bacterium]|nr:zf-HC2 domain-containing protein [Elusimicrobiota bacterium]
MTHEEARAAYSRQLDGALDKPGQELLNTHLAECGECREYCKTLDWSAGALGRLRAVPPVPEELLAKVKESVSAVPAARSRSFWSIPVLVLASAAFVVLVIRNAPPERPQPAPGQAPAPSVAPEQKPPPLKPAPAPAPAPVPSYNDIFSIEHALRTAPPPERQLVFRGAGKEDQLAAALSNAGLKDIALTDEIFATLKSRHKRLAKIEALKTAGKVSEGDEGLLNASAALPEEETRLMQAENSGRAALISLYAARLAGKTGGSAEELIPGVKKEFAAALQKAGR